MIKKGILLLPIYFMAIFLTHTTVSAENYYAPSIYVEGDLFRFKELKPVVRNRRILVPLKSGIFGSVGADSAYDIINKEITVKTKDDLISSYMQELDWYNEGVRCYISDVRSDFLNGEAYVPLRATMESLGMEVIYDDETFSVSIK